MLIVAAAACVPPPPVPKPAPRAVPTPTATPPRATLPPIPPIDSETPAVRLLWVPAVDLDLYVTGPDARTIYFGNPKTDGGALRRDVGCSDRAASGAPSPSERIDLVALVAGTYRVGVDFSDPCTSPARPVPFRVIADLNGTRRAATGTLAPGEFQPAALVFVVPGGDGAE